MGEINLTSLRTCVICGENARVTKTPKKNKWGPSINNKWLGKENGLPHHRRLKKINTSKKPKTVGGEDRRIHLGKKKKKVVTSPAGVVLLQY